MNDSWQPRPHDHLVEPMFAGLHGHRDEPAAAAADPKARRALLVGVVIVLVVIVGRIVVLLGREMPS